MYHLPKTKVVLDNYNLFHLAIPKNRHLSYVGCFLIKIKSPVKQIIVNLNHELDVGFTSFDTQKLKRNVCIRISNKPPNSKFHAKADDL